VESFRFIEMQHGHPWTFQADLYGVCGVMHCMLHGSYMEVVDDEGRYRPKESFKRYWQADDLWKPLFDELLNVPGCEEIPDLSKHRQRFENFLIDNPSRAKLIRTLLAKQSVLMFEHNK